MAIGIQLACCLQPRLWGKRFSDAVPMLAVNFADDQVNPAQLTVARDTVSHLPQARFVLLPGGWGHATIFHAEAWASQLGPFLANLPGQETSR